ncbi:MAG: Xaa-Pro peptidase family protein [bacterium]|nr:Xaa-Pro peptidase family protein [bacterium]
MKFESSFFSRNRLNLRETCEVQAFIFASNGVLQRNGDSDYRFRQDSNFWYLTGVDEPDCWLYMDSTGDYLVLPEREKHRDLWEGSIDSSELTNLSGIKKVITRKQLEARLKKHKPAMLGSIKAPEAYLNHFGMYTNPHRGYLHSYLQKLNLVVHDCRLDLARLRQIKQPVELEAMQSAIDTTCETLQDIKNNLENYKNESDVEIALRQGFLNRGSSEHSFNPIIASGKNAYNIHYRKNNQTIKIDDLLLLDLGAECNNYAADITRTWAVGKPTLKKVRAYELISQVQEFAFNTAKPGITIKQLDKTVRDFYAGKAVAAGFIRSKNHINEIFPYSLSHFLGLDVHDAGDYDSPLAENSVITIEPGLHIKADQLGMRVEDDILITKSGNIILSRNLPRQL